MSQMVQTITKQVAGQLIPILGDMTQAWFEAELLVGYVLKRDRTWIVTHPGEVISKKQRQLIEALSERRAQYEPIAYLIEQAPFFNQSFYVDQRVLIPRPESEILVTRARLKIESSSQSAWTAWDLGTGSGCLGLSLKQQVPSIDLLLSDRSRGALAVAKMNATRLGIKDVQFCGGSLLSRSVKSWLIPQKHKAWMILANLPYLPRADRADMTEQVTRYEPAHALFANKDGTELIEQFLKQLQCFLKQQTNPVCVLLEYDPRQAEGLMKLATKLFPEAVCSPFADQNGDVRFLEIDFRFTSSS